MLVGNILFFISLIMISWFTMRYFFAGNFKSFYATQKADMMTLISTHIQLHSPEVNLNLDGSKDVIKVNSPYDKHFYTVNRPSQPFTCVTVDDGHELKIPLSCFQNPLRVKEILKSGGFKRIMVNSFVRNLNDDDLIKIILVPNNVYSDNQIGYLPYIEYKHFNWYSHITFKLTQIASFRR